MQGEGTALKGIKWRGDTGHSREFGMEVPSPVEAKFLVISRI